MEFHNLHVKIKADPIVELGFSVDANVDANITITTQFLTFDDLIDPFLGVSTEISNVTGTFTGGYLASYKDGGGNEVPFTDLNLGLQQINDTVTAIGGEWNFSLSAGGHAEGNATYTATAVAPEPSTILLLGLGGLALLRKCRK